MVLCVATSAKFGHTGKIKNSPFVCVMTALSSKE
jgi:hypothetical protein